MIIDWTKGGDNGYPGDVPTITVGQLIEALRGFNPAAKVYLEGCDCQGAAFGPTTRGNGTDVMLMRTDGRDICELSHAIFDELDEAAQERLLG